MQTHKFLQHLQSHAKKFLQRIYVGIFWVVSKVFEFCKNTVFKSRKSRDLRPDVVTCEKGEEVDRK